LDKLIIGGHSFGGITAISTTHKDPRIKACLSMDPWFYPYKDDYKGLINKTPFFNI